MKFHTQTDQEIPLHITANVDATAAKKEEQLAREMRSISKRRHIKWSSQYFDLGLTVNKNEATKVKRSVNSKQIIVESEQEVEAEQDIEEHQQVEETEKSLSYYKSTHQDHDKENVDISGRSIFTFSQTIKKSVNTMMRKALEEDEQQQQQGEEVEEEEEAVRGGRRRARKTTKAAVNIKTDHAKRRRLERQVELLKNNNSSEEEEEEESEESDQEAGKLGHHDEREGYERYFQDLHTNNKTSNNTLSKLQILEPQEFHQILNSSISKHVDEIKILSEMHRQHFSQWYFELNNGFNLIFYGYGSKRNLLNEFASKCLTNGPLIVVNGFFPSITVKDILIKITMGILNITKSLGSVSDYIEFICNYFNQPDREYNCLYLLIHNLDGQNLRNEKTQTALSILANSKNIHLICSMDHINSGLLWDNIKSSRFNFIWHDLTTFDNYITETTFENSLLLRSSELGGARGAKFVLDSLTSNARGVFKILAEYQLTEMEIANVERGNEAVGLSYNQYYQKCRENFFVSSDLALKTELTEFKDHKLISTKKSLDGTEFFFIPLDKSTLLSIIEQLS